MSKLTTRICDICGKEMPRYHWFKQVRAIKEIDGDSRRKWEMCEQCFWDFKAFVMEKRKKKEESA